jgi:cell division protein FtsW
MAKRDWGNKRKKSKSNFDWSLLGLVTGLTFFGVLMVYNASVVEAFRVFKDKYYYLKNQSLWALIGLAMMLILSQIDYRHLKKIAGPLFFLNLFLLAIVLIPGIGTPIKGARRWLNLGFFMLQPSELIKLTFALYLASWLEKPRRAWRFLFLIALVFGLIVLEPDLGTLVVIITNAFLIFYLSGISLFKLIPLLGLGILAGMLMIFSSSYRKSRLLTFLDPSRDPLGSSYHIRQVLIALGAGGLWGLGLGRSRQKYAFLPEATSDSIFAIIAEEIGFLGAAFISLIFLIILLKGLLISKQAPDRFGQLLSGGIVGWLGIQTLINLGAMVVLVPLTGLPLPFISYGGSSLIVALSGMGILLSISKKQEIKNKK